MNLNEIKGAVFDLDGTLLDSMWVWVYVDEVFLERHGLPYDPDYLTTLGPMGFHRAAVYTKDYFNMSDSVEDILQEWFLLAQDAYDNKIMLKDGVYEYLHSLKERGVKIAAATSNHPDLFKGTLRRCGIYDCFDAFTVTSEVERNKDHPDVYLLAAERIGTLPEETAVFEDILSGIRGANKGGFYTVGVEEESAKGERVAIQAEANLYIKSFRELL